MGRSVSLAGVGQRVGEASRRRLALRTGDRYRRVVGPVVRFPAGIVPAVAAFAVAGAIGGRVGIAVASAWIAISGSYCLLNFLACGETHCAVTGPGWTLTALLGFVAVAMPGGSLSWFHPNVEVGFYLAVLAIGYGLEWALVPRAGRHAPGHEDRPHAEGR